MPLVGPYLRGPNITSGQRRPRTGRYIINGGQGLPNDALTHDYERNPESNKEEKLRENT